MTRKRFSYHFVLVFIAGLLCATVAAVAAYAQVASPTTALDEAYFDVHGAEAPTRNFIHFYLRLAGVVWVIVEWIAAIYLIRGHALVRSALGTGNSVS